jgi:hypothetical protein
MDGLPIRFHPEQHLPPDIVSEMLGRRELVAMIAHYRYLARNTDEPVRILVPGVGPGTLACSFIAGLDSDPQSSSYTAARNIHIDAFDINPEAVVAARENIGRIIQSRWGDASGITFSVFEGDWWDNKFWDTLEQQSYTQIIANPPFAQVENNELEPIRPGYEDTPQEALAGGRWGTLHYYAIARNAPELLVNKPGAGVIFRLPVYQSAESVKHDARLLRIITEPFINPNDYFLSHVERHVVGEVFENDRAGSWAVVQRTPLGVNMPHYGKWWVQMAIKHGLPSIPTEEEAWRLRSLYNG